MFCGTVLEKTTFKRGVMASLLGEDYYNMHTKSNAAAEKFLFPPARSRGSPRRSRQSLWQLADDLEGRTVREELLGSVILGV